MKKATNESLEAVREKKREKERERERKRELHFSK